jgi:hypothetical protein
MSDPAHNQHPRIARRKSEGVSTTSAQLQNFNDRLAVRITGAVGTMWCAYAFTALALISLPAAIKGGTGPLISWIAQTFLQLVLLSIIMVGQKVAAAASDKQAEQTYNDAEALLEITDTLHRLLKENTAMTAEIRGLVTEKS